MFYPVSRGFSGTYLCPAADTLRGKYVKGEGKPVRLFFPLFYFLIATFGNTARLFSMMSSRETCSSAGAVSPVPFSPDYFPARVLCCSSRKASLRSSFEGIDDAPYRLQPSPNCSMSRAAGSMSRPLMRTVGLPMWRFSVACC